MKKSVLFLCTANSIRSQMAEGLLRHLKGDLYEVYSAGISPSIVNPCAITVMNEIGIDISNHYSKGIDEFGGKTFDIVVTVCDNSRESCALYANAKKLIHKGFEDPYYKANSDKDLLSGFRIVRDQISEWIKNNF